MALKLTHPDNKTFQRFIPGRYVKYWDAIADQHTSNETQTGRAIFKIIGKKIETQSILHEGWVMLTIEYDPNFITHIFTFLHDIGYRSGFADAREVYNTKPKTNKSNETVN